MTTTAAQPFRIDISASNPLMGAALFLSRSLIERMLALPSLNTIYQQACGMTTEHSFVERVLCAAGVKYDVSASDLARIPKTGPLVVVANHPFGGIEGVVLSALLERVRPDVKLMANYLLHRVPELRDKFFFVDPFDRKDSVRRNFASIKSAIDWVKDGGTLGVFPAGEVSHLKLRNGCVTDPPWSDTISRIIRQTKANVLPIFFEGRNSKLFQMAGLVHPRLRTALLPREFLNKRHCTLHARVGNLVSPNRLRQFGRPEDMTAYLRVRTYILKARGAGGSIDQARRSARAALHQDVSLIDPLPKERLLEEIKRLPQSQHLLGNGSLHVFWAKAEHIPDCLQEIGRLREQTFREVGEGTGCQTDLDRFDQYYYHLLAWDRDAQRIVGAYRMGATDEIVPHYGLKGLYTTSLFRFKPRLMKQITPALELGRSFIVKEYQKSYSPLMLLWKGIGRFVASHPHYRYLFGAVSISDEYNTMTKQLLINFLRLNSYQRQLSKLVKPKNPPRYPHLRNFDQRLVTTTVTSMDQVDELVREMEVDSKNMPVLLRQYLKLNAKLLGFNIDSDFGDVLDGLLLVDVPHIDRPVLERYFGKEHSASYLAYHRQ